MCRVEQGEKKSFILKQTLLDWHLHKEKKPNLIKRKYDPSSTPFTDVVQLYNTYLKSSTVVYVLNAHGR